MTISPGQTLSHYHLIEKIGEGGMGVVWKAEDTVLGRTVAIKVLQPDVARDEKRRKMFFDEARLASSLSEAHIVQVHEFGREGDLDFIVMEHVEGKPLNKVLHGRPLPPDKVAEIGHQLASALSKAHRKALLHRDLKPSNILVTPDGDVKVVDFGLATLFSPHDSTVGTEGSTQTVTEGPAANKKSVAGTIPYMSPEQVQGDTLDARSDIFSLGVVLYEMTTGQRPFTGATNRAVAAEILKTRPKPVYEVVPKVPLDLDKIITKSLSSRRADRYQTMGDLAVDLKRLGRDLESGSSPSYESLRRGLAPAGRRSVGLRATAGVLVVAAAVVGMWVMRSWRSSIVEPGTILILPMEVSGQEEGADYFSRAFAEAIAVQLTSAKKLSVLPVPVAGEFKSTGALDRARIASDLGASFVLAGTLLREGQSVRASLNLLNATRNRVVWAAQKTQSDGDLPTLAFSLAREISAELGAEPRTTYENLSRLTGSAEMAASPEMAEALASQRQFWDVERGLKATKKLVDAFPDEPDANVLRVNALHIAADTSDKSSPEWKRYEDGLAALEKVDPDTPWVPLLKAYYMVYEGKEREAIEINDLVLAREDLSSGLRAYVLGRQGEAYSMLGEPEMSFKYFEKALSLDPAGELLLLFISSALADAGRFEEALTRARQAVALYPTDPQRIERLGFSLFQAGRLDESLATLKRACEIGARFCSNYGSVLSVAGRTAEGLSLLSEACESDRFNCISYATALARAGREQEARAAAERVGKIPETGRSFYELASFHAVAGDRAEALSFLRQSVNLGHSSVWIAKDPNFESLHGAPEFEAIVAEAKRRIGSSDENAPE